MGLKDEEVAPDAGHIRQAAGYSYPVADHRMAVERHEIADLDRILLWLL